MIKSGKKSFINSKGTVVSSSEIVTCKADKDTAITTISETIKNVLELAEASKKDFRVEIITIEIVNETIAPIIALSEAFDKAEIFLNNRWNLTPLETFVGALLARHGMTKAAIVEDTDLDYGKVKNAITRCYEKSQIHNVRAFAKAFLELYADYVLPTDHKGNF